MSTDWATVPRGTQCIVRKGTRCRTGIVDHVAASPFGVEFVGLEGTDTAVCRVAGRSMLVKAAGMVLVGRFPNGEGE